MTIPALDINTARDTKLVLNHVGDDYYINKIWVQGKDYGYELPAPKGLKSRENEKVTVTTVAAQATEQNATVPPPVTAQTEARPATQPVEPPVTTPPAAQPTTETNA